MIFKGYTMRFSTIGEKQYEAIGGFWDKLSELYGRENLQGLGYGWTETSLEYCFGFKEDLTEEEYLERLDKVNAISPKPFRYNEIDLPDDEWIGFDGVTDNLGELYSRVYADNSPDYEIETFNDDGTCHVEIHYIRFAEERLSKAYKEMTVTEFLAVLFDVLSFVSIPALAWWIYYVVVSELNASFLTIGLPIIMLILIFAVHCQLLVGRVTKRKAMARLIIDLRLKDSERDQMASKYRVKKFVDSMIEVSNDSVDYTKPI